MTQALFSSEPTADTLGQFFPPKIFAQPFRLVFNRKEDGKTSWIEVRSLAGLRTVFEKLEGGELVEINRFSTVEMQLWGHMAEHVGFLRVQTNTSTLGAGIQPLGEGLAPLAEDLSALMGGDDIHALHVLDAMKSTLRSRPCSDGPMVQPPLTHEYVKPDGVNLTEQGENALLNLVHGTGNVDTPTPNDKESTDAIIFRKEADNAIAIFDTTPIGTPEEVEAEVKEAIDCSIRGEQGGCKKNAQPPEGPIVIGPEAAKVGRLVAEMGRGLDNEADKAVRDEAQAAMDILEAMIQIDKNGLEEAKRQSQDLLERFGVTMDELKALATDGKIHRPRPDAKSKVEPHEAERMSRANLRKLMGEISEIDLAMLVGQSEIEELDPESLAAHQSLTADLKSKLRGTIDQTDAYTERSVTPASEVPTDQEARARWLAEQQRGPASMDTYREDAQRVDPRYGSIEDRKSSDQSGREI